MSRPEIIVRGVVNNRANIIVKPGGRLERMTPTEIRAALETLPSSDKDGNDQRLPRTAIAGLDELTEKLTEDVPVNVGSGSIQAGAVLPAGLSFTEYVKLVHQTTFTPTFQNPSLQVWLQNASIMLIGTQTTVYYTANFSRGRIRGVSANGFWDASAKQNDRSGPVTSYEFPGQTIETDENGYTYDFQHTVAEGNNAFQVKVNYAEGPQPFDSDGNHFQSPLPAGSKTSSSNIVGTWPILGTFDAPDTESQASLKNHLTTSSMTFTLQKDAGSQNLTQRFLIPDLFQVSTAWFKNPIDGQFNTPALGDFAVTQVNRTINGQTVPYLQYKNSGNYKGYAVEIKLEFS